MEISANPIPHIAVLMATYNGEKYLADQLDSILAQKNVRVTLFIRDDNSADHTREIIGTYRQTHTNIYLLPTMPEQLNVTRNFFSIIRDINLSEIDYIAYSDQDDIWLPHKLEAAVNAMTKNQVSCYASNLQPGDANGKPIEAASLMSKLFRYLLNYKSNKQSPWDHYFEAASAGCSLVFGREAALYMQSRLNQIYDRIPENASHDWSTYALTRIGGFKWFVDNNAYIIYRQHSGNAYGTNSGWKGIVKLLDLFRSGWYRRHIIMIDELYNDTETHPLFMKWVGDYNTSSFLSRTRMAFAICRFRRKWPHRILLFMLVVLGYFR